MEPCTNSYWSENLEFVLNGRLALPGPDAEECEDALVGDPVGAGDVELLEEVAVPAQHAHHLVVRAAPEGEHGQEAGVSEMERSRPKCHRLRGC